MVFGLIHSVLWFTRRENSWRLQSSLFYLANFKLEGWLSILEKKTKRRHDWKRQYVVVSKREIFFYNTAEDKTASKPSMILDLRYLFVLLKYLQLAMSVYYSFWDWIRSSVLWILLVLDLISGFSKSLAILTSFCDTWKAILASFCDTWNVIAFSKLLYKPLPLMDLLANINFLASVTSKIAKT